MNCRLEPARFDSSWSFEDQEQAPSLLDPLDAHPNERASKPSTTVFSCLVSLLLSVKTLFHNFRVSEETRQALLRAVGSKGARLSS
jgi:hypothetical protein